MFNRLRARDNSALDRLHDSAVRRATTPGQAPIGLSSTRAPALSTVSQSESSVDASGNTVEGAGLWDIDNWDRFNWS